MNKVVVGLIVVLAFVGVIFFFVGLSNNSDSVLDDSALDTVSGSSGNTDDSVSSDSDNLGNSDSGNSVGTDSGGSGSSKTFVLTGENFKFVMNGVDNPILRVNEGDTVRIEFSSIDGFHDWVLDEFDASTRGVNTGSSTFVEFVADQKGEFEYYCSVGSHRANGMEGMFIVE